MEESDVMEETEAVVEQSEVENIETENNDIKAPKEEPEQRYNLRSRKGNFSQHIRKQFFATQHRCHGVRRMMVDTHRQKVNVMFTQMQARTEIKKHEQRAVAVMFKEYARLRDLDVTEKVKYDDLIEEQRRKALRSINLIKEKHNGVLKGRTVADGRSQRGYVTQDESTSPAIAHETFISTVIIDTFEKRDVGLFDIPGAYLYAFFKKFVLLTFENEFVDMMIEVNPDYASEVRYEGKRKVLYVKLKKALYGCMESALLWYELCSSVLKGLGFTLNPYDKCVANKVINGKQYTVAFYVDDNKISHEDPKVVTDITNKIEARFGKLVVSRGKSHTFLGIDLTYKDDGSVEIATPEYIEEVFEALEEEVYGTVTSIATKNLFNIDNKTKDDVRVIAADNLNELYT